MSFRLSKFARWQANSYFAFAKCNTPNSHAHNYYSNTRDARTYIPVNINEGGNGQGLYPFFI